MSGRAIRIRDPQTGRSMVVYEEPVENYPPPQVYQDQVPQQYQQQYPAPYEQQPYPLQYQQPRRRGNAREWTPERRHRKGSTWFVGVSWFMVAFVVGGLTHPALTIALWGVLLGWLIYRSLTD